MEWKPAEGDMPRVTLRTNINVPNITLVILIITINVFLYVEVCAVLCCFELRLYSLAETMLKESICSCIFAIQVIEILYLLGMRLGEFKLISLNVRGLSNFKKRKSILSWCRRKLTRQLRKKNNAKLNGAAPLSLPMGSLMHEVLEYFFGMVLIAT